jgi:hypothetical protein
MGSRPLKQLPSAEHLRECFEYDRDTGMLTWKVRPRGHFGQEGEWTRWNVLFAGKQAGWLHKLGYRYVTVGSHSEYKVHRIIWKWVTGEDPPTTLDHRDGNRANNRFVNLRAATKAEQTRNSELRKDNSTGHRGVSWNKERGRWKAGIGTGRKRRHLGYFDSAAEASTAYAAAAQNLFGEFYRQPGEGR